MLPRDAACRPAGGDIARLHAQNGDHYASGAPAPDDATTY
jgi:hypothetical protein